MKYFFFVLFIVSQGLMFGQGSDKKIDSTILWNPKNKLNWADFHGIADANTFATALTSYKIDIVPEIVQVDEQDRIQGYRNLTVEARFYKRQSWTTISKNDTIVLKHEQLHFDIAELFARKIRKRFKELQNNEEAKFSVYSKEYSKFWQECRNFQKQFDFETNHGRQLELNTAWLKKVKKELISFEEYR